MQKDIAEILGITHSANGIYRVKKAQKNYNWIYENRKDLVKYLKCKKGKYRVAN